MQATFVRLLLAATSLAFIAGSALAHGDEDHSQDAKKAAPATPAGAAAAAANAPAALQRLA
ncbi:MAG: hypothetical protein Q8S20_19400, partial [Sulfuritalea sp.]|nr:hypothetical protein [Sulfuritalea sp.]